MKMNSNLIYRATSFIPEGKVLTYKGLIELVGVKSPRVAGNILHKNTDPVKIPCHRVVNSYGKVAETYAFGGGERQRVKLQEEGVQLLNNRVVLVKYLWQPSLALKLYFQLLKQYGEPGRWPWFGTGEPHTPEEIAIGAILTQNTNWFNVVKALGNLRKEGFCSIAGIYNLGKTDLERLKKLVRPSGYYQQKAKKLWEFCRLVMEELGCLENLGKLTTEVARERLLSVWGIGKETADVILLYSLEKPVFVIDAYTKKLASFYRLSERLDYNSLQEYFSQNLPEDASLFQDYHALIVWWGKGGC